MNYQGKELIIAKALTANLKLKDQTLDRAVRGLKNYDTETIVRIIKEVGYELEKDPKMLVSLRLLKDRYNSDCQTKKRIIIENCPVCDGTEHVYAVADRMGDLIPVTKQPFPCDDLSVVVLDCCCVNKSVQDEIEGYGRGATEAYEANEFVYACRDLKHEG